MDEIFKKVEQEAFERKFKLVLKSKVGDYFAYKAVGDIQVHFAHMGYGVDNCSDNLAYSFVDLLTRALISPKKLFYMRFDQEPSLVQVSVIGNEIYVMTDTPEDNALLNEKLKTNKNLIRKYGQLVELNTFEIAKLLVEDIENQKQHEQNERVFKRTFQTLKLLIKEKSLSENEKVELSKNISLIKQYDNALEEIKNFYKKTKDLKLNQYTEKQKQTLKMLQDKFDKLQKEF